MNPYKDVPDCEIHGCDEAGVIYMIDMQMSVCPECMLKLPGKWIRKESKNE